MEIVMIIIGSTAIKYWIPTFREPSDLDIMWIKPINNADTSIVPDDILKLIPTSHSYATLDAIYTIKCSHLGWDIKWQKHKSDVLFLKKYGCKLLQPLYDALVAHWKVEHLNKPYLSLYKTKDKFFDDYVVHEYDHDYLHELIAYPNRPLYESCLQDGQQVALDHNKFLLLDKEKQIRMFMEEICVISLERWFLNPKCKLNLVQCYHLALHKTVTALTKNWACDFIIHNIELLIKPDKAIYNHVLNTLKEGKQNG